MDLGAVVDSRAYRRPTRPYSPDRSSGSGSARLGLSQKGEFRRALSQLVQGRRCAQCHNGKGPGCLEPGPPASLGLRGCYPKQDALS